MPRGFILQSTGGVEAGRPVVLLHGRLEGGGPFLVRDDRERPAFWVRAADAARARALGATVRPDEGRRTLGGEPASLVELARPDDVARLRERLEGAGIATFEADVRLAARYLIDRGIRGSLEIRGEGHPAPGVGLVFENPELRPAAWTPALTVLSLDIETDPRAERLLSIALCGVGVAEVLLWTPAGASAPAPAIPFGDEADLLRAFVRRLREIDPDVVTGWNVIDFDLAVLARLAQHRGVRLEIGRGPGPLRIHGPRPAAGPSRALLPGRVVLDGIHLVRQALVRLESYALDAVAHAVLGRGKTIGGTDRAAAIVAAFERERERFVQYNLEDARLVLEILERLQLIELTVQRSLLTGMPPDRVSASVASFDFLYLTELHRRRIVAPSLRPADDAGAPTAGGHVLEPRPGLYHSVLVFDFKSLYPSIVRTFQIDPLGYLPDPAPGDDPIRAPNGAAFRREPGILPGMLDELFPQRAAAEAAGNRVAGQAIKILMNSFYGVLGTPACRFALPELANAITAFGRELLLWSKRRFETSGFDVLYGDTDSLFVRAGIEDPVQARSRGARLATELNLALAAHIAETWRVESRLELQFERLYLRLLLPAVRHGKEGARKRYAGLVETPTGTAVVFTGMEAVRRDWTELARRVQRELYERLFRDRPVDGYLREVVADLRAERFDDLLVYRKALRKELDAYAASAPHVVAARRMGERPGRVIAYVVTTDGPQPAGERRSPIDHEHYVQRQLRAVAEPVLALLDLEFDRVVGDDSQLSLF
jgi:DNA polymerase-2